MRRRRPDQRKLAAAWRDVIVALGYDPQDEHLRDSPRRVARFLAGWHTLHAAPPKLTSFRDGYDEMVVTAGIRFHSVCAHHGLPFFGTAAVGYVPATRVVGLSKLARVVDHYARRFQTQERIAVQVATHLMDELRPVGVGVLLRAEHLCMSMRGIERPGHRTVTSAMRGCFLTKPEARAEFLALANGHGG